MKTVLSKLDELTEYFLLDDSGSTQKTEITPAEKKLISLNAIIEKMYKEMNGDRFVK